MTDLLSRLNVFTEHKPCSFDGIDFSDVDNIVMHNIDIQLNTGEFILQIYSNILTFIKTFLKEFSITPVSGKLIFDEIGFITYKEVCEKFHLNKLKNCIYGYTNQFDYISICNLVGYVMLTDGNLYFEQYKAEFLNGSYITPENPLFGVAKCYVEIIINDIFGKNCSLEEFLKKSNEHLSNISFNQFFDFEFSIDKIIDLQSIVTDPNNIRFVNEFQTLGIPYKKMIHMKQYFISYYDKYLVKICEIYNTFKIYNCDDIEKYNMMTILMFDFKHEFNISTPGLVHYYEHLLKYGFNELYIPVYNTKFTSFLEYICDNWDLYLKHTDTILLFLKHTKCCSLKLKSNIEIYEHQQQFYNEFQTMTVSIDVQDKFTQITNIDRTKCKFIIECSELEKCNSVLKFMPELECYVGIVKEFCKKKYVNIHNTIIYSECNTTIKINNKCITGNVLQINVLLAIYNCIHPTMLYVKRILTDQLFITTLIELIDMNYIKCDNGIFTFAHLPNNTIITKDSFKDVMEIPVVELHSTEIPITNTPQTIQLDTKSMLQCYVCKVLKQNSTKMLNLGQIKTLVLSLNINGLTEISENDLIACVTDLTIKLHIKVKCNKYQYILTN